MSLLVYLIACGTGAVLGLVARPSSAIGRLVGLASLLVAFVAALLIGPTTSLSIGDVALTGSLYSGLFLACAAGSGLLLCVVALASGWPDELAPAILASLAGLAVAITAGDSGVALAAGAAASTAGALVILRTTPRSPESDGRLAEFRTVGLVTAGLLLATIAILRPTWNGQSDSPVFVLAFVGLGFALAVRSGAVPFHVPAARLGRSAVPLAPALLLVLLPAGLGLLAVSWSATTFGIKSDWLGAAVAGLQIAAVATLVLGAMAALVHDELEEVAAYSIVADAGFVLLALAARTDAAAEPARLWLLVFVATKTGLVAWAAAASRAFGTSNVARLRGWLHRTPLLGLALVVIMIATVGWPGGAVYEARSTLIRLGLPGQLQFLFVGSILLSLAYAARLLVIGLLSPTEEIKAARSERPRWAAGPPRSEVTSPAPEPASGAETPAAAGGVGAAATAGAGSAATAALTGGDATDSAPGPVTAIESPTEPATAGISPTEPHFRAKLVTAWRLNLTLEVTLVVLIGAVLAAALAFGSLGASAASRAGIPLDTAAHATPTPTPLPTPLSTTTPQPTLAPRPTAGPSGAGESGSANPSGSAPPSTSPQPVNTSAPGRQNTD